MPNFIAMPDPHLDDLLRRSLPERLEAIDRLWDSIGSSADPFPLSDPEHAELDRRIAEDEAEPPGGPTWDEFRNDLESPKP